MGGGQVTGNINLGRELELELEHCWRKEKPACFGLMVLARENVSKHFQTRCKIIDSKHLYGERSDGGQVQSGL